jgi:type IV pilus assembly protein PilN
LKLHFPLDIIRRRCIASVIGLDITDRRARVVELSNKGSLRFWSRQEFRPIAQFEATFEKDWNERQKGECIRQLLDEHHCTSRYAVTAVRGTGVKTVTTALPASTDDIDEWILDNFDKLVRLPLSPSEVSVRYDIPARTDEEIKIEITFVRNSDINGIRAVAAAAELRLLRISAAENDLVRLLPFIKQPANTELGKIAFHENDFITIMGIDNNGRRSKEVIRSSHYKRETEGSPVHLGEGQGTLLTFDIPGEYDLATALALSGLQGAMTEQNFLPFPEQSAIIESISKSLTQRIALTAGVVVALLLLIPLFFSLCLQSGIDSVDSTLLAQQAMHTDIASLGNQVRELRSQMSSDNTRWSRSNSARVLHELAASAPDGVWFYKVTYKDNSLRIFGYSQTTDKVAEFIKRLESSKIFEAAALKRVGMPQMNEPVETIQKRLNTFQTFEITTALSEKTI